MNDLFAEKCKDPRQFDKIRYMVHSLGTDRMQHVILEMCEVNPYLAVLCYNTAEQNEKLKNSLKNVFNNQLKQLKQVYLFPNLHKAIMLCLAYDAINQSTEESLHDFNKCRKLLALILPGAQKINVQAPEFKNISTNAWEQETIYWIDSIFGCILKHTPSRIGRFIELTKNTPLDINNYAEEMLIAGKFPRESSPEAIIEWLLYIDGSNLYEKLDALDFYFLADYKRLLDVKKIDGYLDWPLRRLAWVGIKRNKISFEDVCDLLKKSTLDKSRIKFITKPVNRFENHENNTIKNKNRTIPPNNKKRKRKQKKRIKNNTSKKQNKPFETERESHHERNNHGLHHQGNQTALRWLQMLR